MHDSEVRTSVIVLSLWIEGDDPVGLRVRVTAASGLEAGEQRESWASSGIDDICAQLRRWLEQFARSGSRPETGGAAPRNGDVTAT